MGQKKGYKVTEVTKDKIRKARKKQVMPLMSDETKFKIGAGISAHWDKVGRVEKKVVMPKPIIETTNSSMPKKRVFTDTHKARLTEAAKVRPPRKPHSEQAKANIKEGKLLAKIPKGERPLKAEQKRTLQHLKDMLERYERNIPYRHDDALQNPPAMIKFLKRRIREFPAEGD